MAPTRRALLGAVAGATALTGCLGGGDGAADGTPTDASTTSGATATATPTQTTTATETSTPTATATETPTATGPAVQVRSLEDHGDVLVGPDEMTLYMFDSDTQDSGSSTCYGGCATAWPPLLVDGEPTKSDAVGAELTTIQRDDGSTQVVANGWPLYYFVDDTDPGDVAGQGANDVWWVLDPDGTPIRS